MAKKSLLTKPVQQLEKSNGDTSAENLVDNDWLVEKLSPYIQVYPKEKIFYITTDGQVFLSTSKNDAENHQHRIDKDNQVISFIVENTANAITEHTHQ